MADQEAAAKPGTPCIRPTHIKAKVLVYTLANTLVQAESNPLADTGGS